jgi:hypothetical protein
VVVTVIVEDVDERAPDLERRAQGACMVSLCEDGAAAIEAAIEAPRQADCEALHRTRKCLPSVSFRNEMYMIRLNRKVYEPRTVTLLGSAKCREDERRKRPLPQGRQPFAQSHGDVDGMARVQRRTPEVGRAWLPAGLTASFRPSTGALPTTAPRAQGEEELDRPLSCASHGNLISVYF